MLMVSLRGGVGSLGGGRGKGGWLEASAARYDSANFVKILKDFSPPPLPRPSPAPGAQVLPCWRETVNPLAYKIS